MSMELMVKAMKIKVGNPLRKLVLVKLADNANDSGECWPSYQHIADQCEISRSTVKAHIRDLEEMGLLTREFRKKGTVNQSNLFHLTLDAEIKPLEKPIKKILRVGQQPPEGVGQEMPEGVGRQMTQGGVTDARGGGAAADPRISHSFEPVIEPTETPFANAQLVQNLPDPKYAFQGQIIRLTHADFDKWQKLYRNLDLPYELQRLDIEFANEPPKNWFVTLSQKLNYQNKNAQPRGVTSASKVQPHWNDRDEWESNFI